MDVHVAFRPQCKPGKPYLYAEKQEDGKLLWGFETGKFGTQVACYPTLTKAARGAHAYLRTIMTDRRVLDRYKRTRKHGALTPP